MRPLFAAALVTMISFTPALAQTIEITPNGSAPSAVGTPDQFTGQVVITPLFPATDDTRSTMGEVTFAPGSRTAWHTHPAGQLLIVTSGKGWVQQQGEARREINSGDAVWIPAGVKHWHGATDTTAMRHIAVSYMRDGKNVDWLEPVTDEQYRK
ncbi:cupin domain-containing protein [Sinorhizobium meliloti]|uniref:(R)-mandelonitrile lyase n=1 Tax=Rhizobium meliloti TaxID=382 RepID=UPI0018E73683|nr:cupin domain-containing protein [Sinorhizobium meliloti]QQF06200.1 cupin domain-containing protein [Sinorhizobium meliloti]